MNVPHLYSPPVDGHLGRVLVLAFVHSAAVDTGVPVPFPTGVFSGHMPRSGTAGPYGRCLVSFLRNPRTAFHYGCTSLHPNNSAGGPFPHTPPAFLVCGLDDGHSDWREVILHCSFAFLAFILN